MAEKPICGKCGTAHWRFVPCAEAELAAEQETVNAARRDALKVVPVWRTGKDREPHDHLRTLTQVAPGVFIQPRDNLIQVAPNVFIQKRPDDAA